MRIQSPLFAMNDLARTQKLLDRALQRLSSGQRINSASDDPAGLSMANGLDAQVRGLYEGMLNLNQAFGFLNVAEGSMSTQTAITQRMRELAVEAANGTLSTSDRTSLNTEFQQLLAEFNRIAQQTNFNGTKLLDGSFSTTNIQVGSSAQQVIPINFGNLQSGSIFPTNTSSSSTTTTGSGVFQNPVNTSIVGMTNSWSIASADFNGDGKLDVVNTNNTNNTLSVFLGKGDGTFNAQTNLSTAAGSGPSVVVTGDYNGDGKQDILVSNDGGGNNSINFFAGNGDGTFKARTTIGVGTGPFSLVTADFNGDGKLDFVDSNDGTTSLSVRLGNGDGTFAVAATINNTSNMADLSIGDFNGDGKMDLVGIDHVNNNVYVWIGNGDGTFKAETATAVPVANSNSSLSVGDLNGDGKLDVVVTDYADNLIQLALGKGDGTFQAATTLATDASPESLFVGDVNGDGKIDLVTAADTSADLGIYLGNGNGTFQARVTKSAGGGTTGIILGDLNGDGVKDLIALDDSAEEIQTYLQGSTTTTTTTGSTIPFDISTQTHASNILSVLDSGLTNLNTQRSTVGAYQNRLQYALNLNTTTAQNLSQAKSQIMDTDYASATADLVKTQILEQAGVSVLAQMNFQNALLLRLFNF